MPWGPVTGVRALQWKEQILKHLNSRPGRVFTAEKMDKIGGESFKKTITDLDRVAANDQGSRWRNEHTDADCFLRDYRYGRRSRKWLFARAEDTRLEGTSELYGNYLTINYAIDPKANWIYKQSPDNMARFPFNTFMDPEP
jgi:hypothetical protein